MHLHERVGGVVLWRGQFGNSCPERRRNLTGSSCQGSNSKCGTAIISERLWLVWPRGNHIRCNCCDRDGASTREKKSSTFSCWRSVGSASRSFGENSRLHNVRIGEIRVTHKKYLGPEPLLRHTEACAWVPVDGRDPCFTGMLSTAKIQTRRTTRCQ